MKRGSSIKFRHIPSEACKPKRLGEELSYQNIRKGNRAEYSVVTLRKKAYRSSLVGRNAAVALNTEISSPSHHVVPLSSRTRGLGDRKNHSLLDLNLCFTFLFSLVQVALERPNSWCCAQV